MKKFMMILLAMLVLLCSISMVSAEDVTDDLALDDSNADGSFTELKNNIEASYGTGIYELDKNYTWTSGDKNFMEISGSNFVIDGKGYTINGNGHHAFSIMGFANLTIKNVTFINCAGAVAMGNATTNDNITIEYCTFNDCAKLYIGSYYTPISALTQVGKVTIQFCDFVDCHCGAYEDSSYSAINFEGKELIVSYSNFTGNKGLSPVYASNNAKAIIEYCNFENNNVSHGNGGALNFEAYYVEVNYCNFTNNIAINNGGAITLYLGNEKKSNTKAIISFCNFNDNKALGAWEKYGMGGAIRAAIVENLTVSSCNFTNNSAQYGGAIGFNLQANANEHKYVDINDCIFEDNKALKYDKQTWGGIGGAISINSFYNSVINQTYLISDCEFTNNTALNGGVLGVTRVQDWSFAAIINLTMNDCDFSLNKAEHNGAVIYIPTLTGTAETKISSLVIDSCNFDENIITTDLKTSGSGYGSAIYNFKANLTVTNSNFTKNKACQGTIYHKSSKFLVVDNCAFEDNYAYGSGSAIYVGLYDSSKAGDNLVNVTNSVFTGNNAIEEAVGVSSKAAVNILQAKKTLIDNCSFINNSACDAGALYLDRTTTVIVNNSIFVSNKAINHYGGAIAINSGDNNYNRNVTIVNCAFANNTANTTGGAIYVARNATVDISYCVFDNNIANINAMGNNAIYLDNSTDEQAHPGAINSFNVDYNFWGDNYKLADMNKFIIWNSTEGAKPITPKYWVLYNIIQPNFVKINQNNTFSLVFNQFTDGKTIKAFDKNMGKFLAGLKVTGSGVVPATALINGEFNFTSSTVGTYTITVFDYFTNTNLKTINIKANYKSLTDLKALVDAAGSSLVLAEDYAYLHAEDNKLIMSVLVNKNMTIDGNGHIVFY